MSARRTIAIIVRDASRVAAVRTRRAPALVGSIAQSRQWSVGEIDAAINVAITSEADAYAAYLAALAAAADPDGVARRQAQASYSASSRLADLADSLRGTRHEAEARRIADEWTGETDPEGRIKKLKRLTRAMEA